jgi:hypothetical protein
MEIVIDSGVDAVQGWPPAVEPTLDPSLRR